MKYQVREELKTSKCWAGDNRIVEVLYEGDSENDAVQVMKNILRKETEEFLKDVGGTLDKTMFNHMDVNDQIDCGDSVIKIVRSSSGKFRNPRK